MIVTVSGGLSIVFLFQGNTVYYKIILYTCSVRTATAKETKIAVTADYKVKLHDTTFYGGSKHTKAQFSLLF